MAIMAHKESMVNVAKRSSAILKVALDDLCTVVSLDATLFNLSQVGGKGVI